MKVVSKILPFKTNNYVVLIDWNNVPNDPMFVLTFPQKNMLIKKHFDIIADLIKSDAKKQDLDNAANKIRSRPLFPSTPCRINGTKHPRYYESLRLSRMYVTIDVILCTYPLYPLKIPSDIMLSLRIIMLNQTSFASSCRAIRLLLPVLKFPLPVRGYRPRQTTSLILCKYSDWNHLRG